MTLVYCGVEECIHNRLGICRNDAIDLAEEHYCIGGCDDGWEFEEEEEEEEE